MPTETTDFVSPDSVSEIDISDVIMPNDADLTESDGNAFMVMGYVGRKLRNAGNSNDVIDRYYAHAKAKDYDHLLRVSKHFIGDL